MKKIFSLFVTAVMAVSAMAQVTDVLTAEKFAATGTTYTEFSNVQINTAVYAGKSAKSAADAIQLRSNGSDCGIVTTTSGGTIKSIAIVFEESTAPSRELQVYASNEAYTAASQLYGNPVGENVVTFTMSDGASQSYEFESDYAYVGVRSKSGALYLSSITITWNSGEVVECTSTMGLNINGNFTNAAYNANAGYGAQWEALGVELKENDVFSFYNKCEESTVARTLMSGSEYFSNNEGEYTVLTTGTYNFYIKDGNDEVYVTKEADPVVTYSTCADVNAAENNAELTLGAFQVVYANGAYTYIKDETGMTLIYKANYGLNAGDQVAAGMAGKVSIYKGLPEFVPSTEYAALTVVEGDAPEFATATAVPTFEQINQVLVFNGVTGMAVNGKNATGTFMETEVAFYNTWNIDLTEIDATKAYTIVGAVSMYNTLQVNIISIEEEGDAPCVDNYGLMVNENYVAGTFNNGQWEIINLALKSTDIISVYSRCAETAFIVNVAEGADYFTIDGTDMMVEADGVYSFYLKLEYQNDQLYVVKEETPEVTYNTCAEVNGVMEDTEMTLGEVTVVFAKGSNVYVQDASATTLVYSYNLAQMVEAGSVVTGLKGTAKLYNGLPEMAVTDVTDVTVTEGVAPVIADATAVPTASEVNQVMMFRCVAMEAGEFASTKASNINGTFMGETVAFRNNWKDEFTFEAGKTYTMLGCVAIYNGNIQVYVTNITEDSGESTGLDIINAEQTESKVIRNGQLLIIRDGKLYNAQGAEVR